MMIREYRPSDEQGWLRCRVISFLDCSYWNDVKTSKEAYAHPAVSLVAEELVFQAALDRKEELKPVCCRIDEVRLYAKMLR